MYYEQLLNEQPEEKHCYDIKHEEIMANKVDNFMKHFDDTTYPKIDSICVLGLQNDTISIITAKYNKSIHDLIRSCKLLYCYIQNERVVVARLNIENSS